MVAVLPFSGEKEKKSPPALWACGEREALSNDCGVCGIAMLASPQNPHEGMSTGLFKTFLLS
jgi:hypothetical protein